jgi:hypothetical protein
MTIREENIKDDLKESGREAVDLIQPAKDRVQWRALVTWYWNFEFYRGGVFPDNSYYQLL